MKLKIKVISIMMIMAMIISGMSFSTYAATSTNGAVYVDVTQDYAKAQKVLKLVNKQRTKRGLKKLTLDTSLTTAAIQRSAEIMIVIPTTSPHKRPNGKYAKTAHKLATRENCAEGYYDGPSDVVNTWMHSKGHKATILLKSARSCGIAYVNNPSDEDVGYFVLIVSNSKAKKKQTSKKKVSYTKKVVALSKYLKKSYFYTEDVNNKSALNPDGTTSVKNYYSGPYTFAYAAPEINPKSFTWTSSDTGVATVDSKGNVSAVGPGTVKIKAKLKKGPSITLSQEYTVNDPEYYFDKLTSCINSEDLLEEYSGYSDENSYMRCYRGTPAIYEETTDPETGETEVTSWCSKDNYLFAPESRIGSELAFLYKVTQYDNKEYSYEYRNFMVVTKTDGSVDDTLTFIHDYMDKDHNCIYRLEATADRSAVDLENLEWEVVQSTDGTDIDYDIADEQIQLVFRGQYVYGVKWKYLGITRVY